jgi:hypothetical protein
MGRRIGRPKRFSGGVGRPGSGEFSGSAQPNVPSGSTATTAAAGAESDAVLTESSDTAITESGATVSYG